MSEGHDFRDAEAARGKNKAQVPRESAGMAEKITGCPQRQAGLIAEMTSARLWPLIYGHSNRQK